MNSEWKDFELKFLKKYHKVFSIKTLIRALKKDANDIINMMISMNLIAPTEKEIVLEKSTKSYSKYVKKGTKFPKIKQDLILELDDRFKNSDEVIINSKEIAKLWDIPLKQTVNQLLKMLKDDDFPYKLLKRDLLGFNLFIRRNDNDTFSIPKVQKELLVNDIDIIAKIPKVKRVRWTKTTDRILQYIVDRIEKEGKDKLVRVSNGEISKSLGINISIVRTHSHVIADTEDCIIERLPKVERGVQYNYYQFKNK